MVIDVDKLKMMGKKNKKGWIRIAEAFAAILIVMGAAIIVVGGGGVQEEATSKEVYDVEMSILKEIQLNNTLRNEILGITNIPLEGIEFSSFPIGTKDKITDKTPELFECVAKICPPESPCLLLGESEKNVYAQSILITSTLDLFKPRQLKLFCWEK